VIVPRPSGFIEPCAAPNREWLHRTSFGSDSKPKGAATVLKAYFDDSNMGQGPVAVLGGWVAPPATWTAFRRDWDDVLRMKPRIGYFKWYEARGLSGQFNGISPAMRDEKLGLLVDVLATHDPLGIVSVISNDLHRQVFGSNPDKIMRGPYFLSFYSVVAQAVQYVHASAPTEQVEFTFDIQPGQMDAAFASWQRMRDVAPLGMNAIIGNVSFNNDVDVLPLQAADLTAGFTREQAEEACFGGQVPAPPWGDRGSTLKCLTRTWTEDIYRDLASSTGAFVVPKSITGGTWDVG
jgi:hypothetical protein